MSLDIKDLRKKSKKELNELLEETLKNIRTATQEMLDNSTKDSSKAKKLRKDVARIKTVLSENLFSKEIK